ncbi:MAG TPA: hypothetical protein VI894_00255 [Candidatus Nanoarchaeia archaeon]|nr:hypothetical protein [Candidatus Nanoarchaeia archaeon]
MMSGESIEKKVRKLFLEAAIIKMQMAYSSVKSVLEEINASGCLSDFVCPYRSRSNFHLARCSQKILRYQQDNPCPYFKPMQFCNYNPEK